MSWKPRFSTGFYHHTNMADGPSAAQIDAAFRRIDQIPDLDGIEFFTTDVLPENVGLIRKRLEERGLACSMIHHGEPYNRKWFPNAALTAPTEPERRKALDMCLRAVEIARELGAPGIYVFTPMDGQDYPFQTNFRTARMQTMDALNAICDAAGDLRVALEYRPYQPRGWAQVGSMSKVLEIIYELNRPNLGAQLEVSHTIMSGENLAQAAWEAARRGRLYHVHLNDTQLPQDMSTIFGSQHFWECLEMLYWLREADYPNYLGFDVVWVREEPVSGATQYVRNVQFMLRVIDALNVDTLTDAMSQNDIIATQAMLWTALRETS